MVSATLSIVQGGIASIKKVFTGVKPVFIPSLNTCLEWNRLI
jgi:hypothetical protein